MEIIDKRYHRYVYAGTSCEDQMLMLEEETKNEVIHLLKKLAFTTVTTTASVFYLSGYLPEYNIFHKKRYTLLYTGFINLLYFAIDGIFTLKDRIEQKKQLNSNCQLNN